MPIYAVILKLAKDANKRERAELLAAALNEIGEGKLIAHSAAQDMYICAVDTDLHHAQVEQQMQSPKSGRGAPARYGDDCTVLRVTAGTAGHQNALQSWLNAHLSSASK